SGEARRGLSASLDLQASCFKEVLPRRSPEPRRRALRASARVIPSDNIVVPVVERRVQARNRSNTAATTTRGDDDGSSLSMDVRFRQVGRSGGRGGGNEPSSESSEMGGAMRRSSTAAATTRRDDVGSSLSIAQTLWKLAKQGTERGVVHSSRNGGGDDVTFPSSSRTMEPWSLFLPSLSLSL
ncbi:hypothetical protein B296_00042278, partial [Ensete ventricosum]